MRDRLTTPSGWLMRPWTFGDAERLPAALTAEEAARQLGRAVPDAAVAREWVANRRVDWDAGAGYTWLVESGAGELAGSVSVSPVERAHDLGWVSYWTALDLRGRGVAGEAARTIADWAFRDLGLFRLELGHRTNNPASCAVARQAGFRVEGLQRARLRYGSQRFDVETHARLASDSAAEEKGQSPS